KKKDQESNNYFTCACLMIVAAGVLLGSALFLLAYPLLRLMGAEGELLELAVQYLRVYALCAPVTTIIFAVDNYLRICGKIRESMFLRSEEHTSELQSRFDLVCRLLLEKKKVDVTGPVAVRSHR